MKGLVPHRVRMTVHASDGRDFAWILVHHRGKRLRELSEDCRVDVVPLTEIASTELVRLLGLVVGFRVTCSDGRRLRIHSCR